MSLLNMRDLSILWSAMKDRETRTGTFNYIGNTIKRHMNNRCNVCNDLQPDGDESSIGNATGLINYDRAKGPEADAARAEVVAAGPALQLDDVKMKEVLECRMKDAKGKLVRDCRFCRFLCDVIDEVFPYHKAVWEARMERGTMRGRISLMIRRGWPLVVRCQGDNFENGPDGSQYRVDIEVFRREDEVESLGVAAEQGGILPEIGSAKTIPTSSDSEESREFVERQYLTCLTEHEACRAAAPAVAKITTENKDFAPTRVLRVTDDRVRMVDTWQEGDLVTWAALSHCWGAKKAITLNKANIDALRDNIDWQDLPPTFRDAITVTRRLDIPYLWIDSLCIIQDDEEDWQRESAEMSDIYGKATLVIVGGVSWASSEPFLCEREDKWQAKQIQFQPAQGPPVTYNYRRRTILASRLEQGLREPRFTSDWATLRRPGHLYQRGWCFQEAFLAIRAIHFNPGGLVFECKTHRALEGKIPPYPSTTDDELGKLSGSEKWRMIVKAYSRLDLTYNKDKLPAISGVAAALQKQSGDTYLAGAWQSTLLYDILWHVMPGGQDLAVAYPLRPYIAPSWSWASLKWGVVWTTYRGIEFLATVETVLAPSKGINPLGEVGVSALQVRGRVLRCHLRVSWKTDECFASIIRANGSKSTEQWFLSDGLLVAIARDESDTQSKPDVRRARIGESSTRKDFETEATFLCLGKTHVMEFDHIGLILGKCPLGKPFPKPFMERIGEISNLPRAWYEAGTEDTVLIL